MVCRSKQSQIRHIQDETASSAEEDNWMPNKLHLIQRTINSTSRMDDNRADYYTRTLLVNNRPIKFIVDTGSPVTLIPMAKFNNKTEIKPMTERYKDVNDNNINFVGKTMAKVESNGCELKLELLITKRQRLRGSSLTKEG